MSFSHLRSIGEIDRTNSFSKRFEKAEEFKKTKTLNRSTDLSRNENSNPAHKHQRSYTAQNNQNKDKINL